MADTSAPHLRRTSPSDNATSVSVTSNLTLTFNESVKAGSGFIKIYKSDGTLFRSISATDTSQVTFSGRTVTINPSVNLDSGTNYYVLVDNGAIKDIAGNNYGGISSSTAFNFRTSGSSPPPTDTTAPLLTGTSPNDNATDVDVGANLILTFNEAVKAGTGNVEIRNAANGSLVQSISITDATKVSFSGNQLTINPSSDLSPEASYYVTFASGVVRDLANNAFAGISSAAVFSFATESDYVDTTAPIVLFASPDGYVTGGENIVITFNEPVRAGSGVIKILNAADDSVYLTISVTDATQVSFSGRDVIINPTNDLPPGNYYVAIAPSAFEDLYGNTIDDTFSVGASASALAIASSGVTGYGAFASAISQGTVATGVSAYAAITSEVSASAFATATGIELPGLRDTIAGNDASLDVSAIDLDAAVNGTLVSVTDGQVDILGTDGLTYRVIGVDFNTAASTVAEVDGLISAIEVWAGFGASAHILYTHYDFMLSLPPPGTYNIADSLGGDDTIIGSSDDDILYGFNGDDVLAGREGNDQLNGGAGYDTYKFVSIGALNGDTIVGFEGGDTLDFSAIAGLNFIGSSAFSGVAGQMRYQASAGNTILQVDSNGDGAADASLTLGGGSFGLGETAPGSKILILTNDVVAPVLVSTSPVDNATGVAFANSVQIVLTFNENVTAGSGVFEIRRSSDGSLIHTIDVTNPNVHFDGYTVRYGAQGAFESSTSYYVTFAPGVILDVAGNAHAGISSPTTFNFTTAFVPDTTAPLLLSTSPTDNASAVAPGANLVLTFSEPITAGNGNIWIKDSNGALFRMIPAGDATQVTISGNTLTINPNVNLLAGTNYFILVGLDAVRDTSGNSFAGYSSSTLFNFATASSGGDVSVPQLLAITPTAGSTDVPVDTNIVLTFNEVVQAGYGNIEIIDTTGAALHTIDIRDTSQVTFSGNTITINPSVILSPDKVYGLDYEGFGVILDLAGNGFGAPGSPATSFRTGGTPGLVLTGNALSNTLVGGAGNDAITGAGLADLLTGAGGSDTFVYNSRTDSAGRYFDTITDFDASADLIDLWFQVTGMDPTIATGSLTSRYFDTDVAAAVGSSKLAANHAVVFTPNGGTYAGKTFLVIDANGTAGYQATGDMVILLGSASSLGGLSASDFV